MYVEKRTVDDEIKEEVVGGWLLVIGIEWSSVAQLTGLLWFFIAFFSMVYVKKCLFTQCSARTTNRDDEEEVEDDEGREKGTRGGRRKH